MGGGQRFKCPLALPHSWSVYDSLPLLNFICKCCFVVATNRKVQNTEFSRPGCDRNLTVCLLQTDLFIAY